MQTKQPIQTRLSRTAEFCFLRSGELKTDFWKVTMEHPEICFPRELWREMVTPKKVLLRSLPICHQLKEAIQISGIEILGRRPIWKIAQ